MSKDKSGREQKKTRKDAKKILSVVNTQPPPPPVEVIKRGKKEKLDF